MIHWHVCENDGHYWSHEEKELGGNAFVDYHRCPKCGCGPYTRKRHTEQEAADDAAGFGEDSEINLLLSMFRGRRL